MMFPKFFWSNTTSWVERKWKFRNQDWCPSETEIISLNRIDAWELKNKAVENYDVPTLTKHKTKRFDTLPFTWKLCYMSGFK